MSASSASTSSAQADPAAFGDDAATARPRLEPGLWIAVGLIGLVGAQLVGFLIGNPRFGWDVVAEYLFAPIVLRGLMMTLVLSIIAMLIGFSLGTVIGVMRLSRFAPLRVFGTGWVSFWRAIPLLVQLILWYNLSYLVPEISFGLPFGPSFWSWDANELITPFTAAILGLSLHESAYSAEHVRAGILSVDDSQRDAAKAVGMGPRTTFFRIVLPQAMRVIIPPTGNQIIGMTKGTALVSVIAMTDLLGAVQSVYNRTFEIIPMLVVACIWYLVIITVMYLGQSRIEQRFSRGYVAIAQHEQGALGRLLARLTRVGGS